MWRVGRRRSTPSPHTGQPQSPIGWQDSQARDRLRSPRAVGMLSVTPHAEAGHCACRGGHEGAPHAPRHSQQGQEPHGLRKMPTCHCTERPGLQSGGTSMRGRLGPGCPQRCRPARPGAGGSRRWFAGRWRGSSSWAGGTGGVDSAGRGRGARPLLRCAHVTGLSCKTGRHVSPPSLPFCRRRNGGPEWAWPPLSRSHGPGTRAAPHSCSPTALTGWSEATSPVRGGCATTPPGHALQLP